MGTPEPDTVSADVVPGHMGFHRWKDGRWYRGKCQCGETFSALRADLLPEIHWEHKQNVINGTSWEPAVPLAAGGPDV